MSSERETKKREFANLSQLASAASTGFVANILVNFVSPHAVPLTNVIGLFVTAAVSISFAIAAASVGRQSE